MERNNVVRSRNTVAVATQQLNLCFFHIISQTRRFLERIRWK